MKKLIVTILALATMKAFAQSETVHPFPRKISDLSKKTNITKSNSLGVLNRLVFLNPVNGPVVLRVCVTKPDFESSTYLNIKLDDRESSIADEYIGSYDREARTQDDFVLCRDTEFRSYKQLNDKRLSVYMISESARSVYVEVFPKEKPSLSWPVLASVTSSGVNDQIVMLFEFHKPE